MAFTITIALTDFDGNFADYASYAFVVPLTYSYEAVAELVDAAVKYLTYDDFVFAIAFDSYAGNLLYETHFAFVGSFLLILYEKAEEIKICGKLSIVCVFYFSG